MTPGMIKGRLPPVTATLGLPHYAGWVEKLEAQDIEFIYSRFRPGHSLANDLKSASGEILSKKNSTKHIW